MKRKGKLFIMSFATMAAFVLGSCAKEVGITYTLLWGTTIQKLNNNLVVKKAKNDGITNIYKEVNKQIKDELKVMVMTDFHLDHKQDCCNYTFTMIAKNIMNVKPDLVLLCGDNITSIEQKPRARQFAKLMEELGVYWSFVLGNHEGEDYPEKDMMSRPEQVEFFSKYSHCLIDPSIKKTSDGTTVWGDGNHAINVLNSKGEVAQTFFFLDSGVDMTEEQMTEYQDEIKYFVGEGKASETTTEFADYIKDSQIKWYQETMRKYPTSNATIFSHVPLKDMEDAYLDYYYKYNHQDSSNQIWEHDQGAGTRVNNINIWPYTEVTGFVENCDVKIRLGRRSEDMCYSPHDVRDNPIYDPDEGLQYHTPMFKAMMESGGAHPAFFCGHDHQNNFVLDERANGKLITMGYIQPACYSSNNFWTKGMLTEDPLSEPDKYHLIQGYSVMNFNLADATNPFSIQHYTNYDVWRAEHYIEALQYIQASRNPPKYGPAYNQYDFDPNNPLRGIDPPEQLA